MVVAEIEETEVDPEVEKEEEIEMSTEEKADASIARERVIRLLIAKKAVETEMVVEVETPDQAATHLKKDTTEEEADPQKDTTREEETTEEVVEEEIPDQEVTPETTKEETTAEVVANPDPVVHLTIAKTTTTMEMADVKRGLVDLDLSPEAMKAKENTPETHDQMLLLKTMTSQVVPEKLDLKAQNPEALKTLTVATDRTSQETKEATVLQ